MANIIFTNECNINCPYCFAVENNFSENEKTKTKFDSASVWELSSFLNSELYRFCGGEPTCNDQIIRTIKILLKENKFINIMTNGIWPDTFIEFIATLPSQYLNKVSFLFNLLENSFYKDFERKQLFKTLKVINPNMSVFGFTIYKKDFNYSYLLDLAAEYKVNTIRWSLAAPTITNKTYSLEKHFAEMTPRIVEFIQAANQKGIDAINDCCYIPPCFFNKADLADVLLSTKHTMSFKCGTASPLDIDSEGNAWRCYGLFSVMKTHIRNFNNENELGKYFNRRIKLLDSLIPYKECNECEYRMKTCYGGCYAIRVQRALNQNPDVSLFPIDDDHEVLNCICSRDKALIIQNLNNGSKRLVTGSRIIDNPGKNMLSFLNEIDGEKTVGDLVRLWQSNFDNYDEAKKVIVDMCRTLFELDFIQVKYDFGLQPESVEELKNISIN